MAIHLVTRVLAATLSLAMGIQPATGPDAKTKVRSVIDGLRDVQLSTLNDAEGRKLEQRLHEALETLSQHPIEARLQIRDALDAELEDHFLLLELSQLFVLLNDDAEEDELLEVVPWVARADPSAFPDAYFNLASAMAASRCTECLDAVLRILGLSALSAVIPAHSLPIDLDLGLLFVLGPFGADLTPVLLGKLQRGSCIERRNSARVLGFLLPREFPRELKSLIESAACSAAKAEAWRTAGTLGHTPVLGWIERSLAESTGPEEQLGMVEGARGLAPEGRPVLEILAESEHPEVVAAATAGLAELAGARDVLQDAQRRFGSAADSEKSAFRARLEATAASADLEFEGSVISVLERVRPGGSRAPQCGKGLRLAATLRRVSL